MPNNIKLTGQEETFNVRVNYDTEDLYGKISATQPMVIYRD